MLKYFFLSGWLLMNVQLSAQDIPADAVAAYENIETVAIRAHMRFLADDLLQGRKPFTPGYRIAAHYVAAQFEEMGLKPGVGDTSFFQPASLYINRSKIEGNLSLKIRNETKKLIPGEDFILLSEPGKITQANHEIVFGGLGVQDTDLGYNDLELDIRNKYVILVFDFFKEGSYEFHLKHSNERLLERLKKAGAAGIIFYVPPDMQSRFSWNGFKSYVSRKKYQAGQSDFPVFMVDWSVINEIFKSSGKDFEAYKSGKSLASQFRIKATVQPDLKIIPDYEIRESPNVIAMLEGSDQELKNEYFIYTAHLDHVGTGRSVDGDSIYNGAYDNASGVAIMLEMAKAYTRLQTPPKRSILFIALTAEEMGLLGSEYYVNNPVVPLKKTTGMLNLDMFLMEEPLEEIVVLGESLSGLGHIAYRAAELTGIRIMPDPIPEEKIFMRSDHFNFAKKGVPALFLINSYQKSDTISREADINYWWLKNIYHSPLDNFSENIYYDAGVTFARINFLIGYIAASRKEKIEWNFEFPE
jgi:hypothetical protein